MAAAIGRLAAMGTKTGGKLAVKTVGKKGGKKFAKDLGKSGKGKGLKNVLGGKKGGSPKQIMGGNKSGFKKLEGVSKTKGSEMKGITGKKAGMKSKLEGKSAKMKSSSLQMKSSRSKMKSNKSDGRKSPGSSKSKGKSKGADKVKNKKANRKEKSMKSAMDLTNEDETEVTEDVRETEEEDDEITGTDYDTERSEIESTSFESRKEKKLKMGKKKVKAKNMGLSDEDSVKTYETKKKAKGRQKNKRNKKGDTFEEESEETKSVKKKDAKNKRREKESDNKRKLSFIFKKNSKDDLSDTDMESVKRSSTNRRSTFEKKRPKVESVGSDSEDGHPNEINTKRKGSFQRSWVKKRGSHKYSVDSEVDDRSTKIKRRDDMTDDGDTETATHVELSDDLKHRKSSRVKNSKILELDSEFESSFLRDRKQRNSKKINVSRHSRTALNHSPSEDESATNVSDMHSRKKSHNEIGRRNEIEDDSNAGGCMYVNELCKAIQRFTTNNEGVDVERLINTLVDVARGPGDAASRKKSLAKQDDVSDHKRNPAGDANHNRESQRKSKRESRRSTKREFPEKKRSSLNQTMPGGEKGESTNQNITSENNAKESDSKHCGTQPNADSSPPQAKSGNNCDDLIDRDFNMMLFRVAKELIMDEYTKARKPEAEENDEWLRAFEMVIKFDNAKDIRASQLKHEEMKLESKYLKKGQAKHFKRSGLGGESGGSRKPHENGEVADDCTGGFREEGTYQRRSKLDHLYDLIYALRGAPRKASAKQMNQALPSNVDQSQSAQLVPVYMPWELPQITDPYSAYYTDAYCYDTNGYYPQC
ncbi:unnamed protein product [Mesocestoides corti]|uniref:Bromo domain-containing protein n=1 Tax=Mesocestoides corti TaxID=53468 RepID=A0A0R3U2X1_MESCO|nr:unnamed protein product [Mesocestoides corti]